MLFRIFKGSRPVVLVMIVIFGVLLWLKSFVLQSVSEFSFDFHQLPFYQFISGIFNKTNLFSLFLSFILFVIHGFLMNRLNKKYILIKERTYLPALFFILISASYIPLQRLSPVIISSIILLFVIELIFDSYKKEGLNLNYFTSSFLLSIAALFYIPMVFFILLIFIGLVFFRSFNWREWIIVLIGFISPYIFILSYYYLTRGSIEEFYYSIKNNFIPSSSPINFNLSYIIFYLYVSFLIGISSYNMIRGFSKKKIVIRKFYLLFLWMFIISLAMYFVLPFVSIELLIVVSIPVSYLLTHYFVSIRSKWWTEVLFFLFIAGLGFIIFYN